MESHAERWRVDATSGEAGSSLGEASLEGSVSAHAGVGVYCRAPQVHDAWRRCSSGVFTTCPMCDRDSLSDRLISHH